VAVEDRSQRSRLHAVSNRREFKAPFLPAKKVKQIPSVISTLYNHRRYVLVLRDQLLSSPQRPYGAELDLPISLSLLSSFVVAKISASTHGRRWHKPQNRNAQKIADRAGLLYDKFVGFIADMEMLGARLDGACAYYVSAMGKLSKGHGNLVR
jgi:DNA recombination protein RmuC